MTEREKDRKNERSTKSQTKKLEWRKREEGMECKNHQKENGKITEEKKEQNKKYKPRNKRKMREKVKVTQ